jgi:hypothetical protein
MGFIVNFFARPILIGFPQWHRPQHHRRPSGQAAGGGPDQPGCLSGHPGTARRTRSHPLAQPHGRRGHPAVTYPGPPLPAPRPRSPGGPGPGGAGGVPAGLGRGGACDSWGWFPPGCQPWPSPRLATRGGRAWPVAPWALVIVSFTSGMLTARSFRRARTGDSIDADREMRAFGFANVASGLFGGFAVTGGGFTHGGQCRQRGQDATGIGGRRPGDRGGRSFSDPAPGPSCPSRPWGAVLIFSAWGLLDLAAYRELLVIDRLEFGLALGTTLGVLVIGVLPGVMLAILLALSIVLIRDLSAPGCPAGDRAGAGRL